MASRMARELYERYMEVVADRAAGFGRTFVKFSSTTSSRQMISNIADLPAQISNGDQLFDADGNPIFFLGWSALDGGDVLG